MNPLKALRSQLGKLQRLAQPYFLPVEETHAWQFLLLVVAMLAVVVGSTLLLLTGAVELSGALVPELRSRFLPGVPEQVAAIWRSPAGVVVMVLTAAGLLRGTAQQAAPGPLAALAAAGGDRAVDPGDQRHQRGHQLHRPQC
jgi:putative ATP-binding cassette transporter